MKKPKTARAETPSLVSKAEEPLATAATEAAKPKNLVAQMSSKPPKATATKVAPDAKAGQPTPVATKAKPKTTSAKKSIKKPIALSPKSELPAIKQAHSEPSSSDSIWPNWLDSLLKSFGVKK